MPARMKTWVLAAIALLSVSALTISGLGIAGTGLTPMEELGRFLYFDENLSEPAGQSCASCHTPDAGFDDPDNHLPVSEGVIPGLFGGRNSPMSAYAMYAPARYYDDIEGLWIGGQFWDGRATGDVLGDPLADQALGPFVNPVEMANPNKDQVIYDVRNSRYAELFEKVWGKGSFDDVEEAYNQVALSIAEFERTQLFGQFSSKYDAYLSECVGNKKDDLTLANCAQGINEAAAVAKAFFSEKEWKGFQLFMGENNNDGIREPGEGAMCAACHVAEWTSAKDYALPVQVPSWAPNKKVPPLFTDFTFDNLGIPKSRHRLLAGNPPDLGLGATVGDPAENGKFKVMPLRNIRETAPYGHNGFFEQLTEITHFYNTRDVKGMGWKKPEYPATVNHDELGNLGLSSEDEDALVAFMNALSDGWTP